MTRPGSSARALVLASKSASRQDMLRSAGVPFEARPADVDERAVEAGLGGARPDQVALALAEAKALAVEAGDAAVLGSDSLVVLGNERFDKPASREDAARHLRAFSGRVMQLHAAAAIAISGDIVWRHSGVASLQVRELSDEFIEAYLQTEWPEVSYCVGVFRMEALGVQIFERIEGDYFTILGMPLVPVLGALREIGVLQS
ncbi:Maf family protein [Paraurantiacibacter namhicola]|uniref:Nucleoside triphosphate pyrophosphatase n=1 Tax=Paraurantiacibacter namhicola TaxID=645517 RepID=A0A1C7D5M3_9SPHN|nr:Maf family protein [Paraurantiacibacter namhicola]ANU06757.1 Maf-like protein YceF [Paraurantiacibacter namhicola]